MEIFERVVKASDSLRTSDSANLRIISREISSPSRLSLTRRIPEHRVYCVRRSEGFARSKSEEMRRERTLLPGDVARETLGDLKIRIFHAHEIFIGCARREQSRVVKEEIDVSLEFLLRGC